MYLSTRVSRSKILEVVELHLMDERNQEPPADMLTSNGVWLILGSLSSSALQEVYLGRIEEAALKFQCPKATWTIAKIPPLNITSFLAHSAQSSSNRSYIFRLSEIRLHSLSSLLGTLITAIYLLYLFDYKKEWVLTYISGSTHSSTLHFELCTHLTSESRFIFFQHFFKAIPAFPTCSRANLSSWASSIQRLHIYPTKATKDSAIPHNTSLS